MAVTINIQSIRSQCGEFARTIAYVHTHIINVTNSATEIRESDKNVTANRSQPQVANRCFIIFYLWIRTFVRILTPFRKRTDASIKRFAKQNIKNEKQAKSCSHRILQHSNVYAVMCRKRLSRKGKGSSSTSHTPSTSLHVFRTYRNSWIACQIRPIITAGSSTFQTSRSFDFLVFHFQFATHFRIEKTHIGSLNCACKIEQMNE